MMAGHLTDHQSLYIPTNGSAENNHEADFVNNISGNSGGGNFNLHIVTAETNEDRLEFDSSSYAPELLVAMGNLRRQNQFCDAVLRVGEREVSVHRAVLAACSPFLFELFERSADAHHTEMTNQHHSSSMYKVKEVTFAPFAALLDYMYSGRLSVAAQDVGEVYRTAKLLRMERVARACAAFLTDRLTPATCLGLRMLCEGDMPFRDGVDKFIANNIAEVIGSKLFFGLPELRVDIIGAEEAIQNGGQEGQLFSLVLDWARNSVDKNKPKVDHLTEEVTVLYLNAENHLQDCKDVDDSRVSDDDLVTDYRKHSRRRSTLTAKNQASSDHLPSKASNQGTTLPVHVFNISPEGGVTEKEWSIIATIKQKGPSYMGLAVLAGKMTAVSIHLRPVAVAATPSGATTTPLSLSTGAVTPMAVEALVGGGEGERCASLLPLPVMASSRCAFGVCVADDSFVVCGGYDRGECLSSVEMYTPSTGRWSKLPGMLTPRARFGAAAVRDRLYTIGGCDGVRDLDTVHCFSFHDRKWSVAAPLKIARSSVGVAEVCGQIYCVGGSDGQRSLTTCEMYDVDTDKWTFIAPLNTARFQASVSCYQDSLIAVGGTDSWNCLSSVEMYQPDIDAWTFIAPLGTIRRGAGIDMLGDTLWVVGGSDGASSLSTTETYHPAANAWTPGPPLATPRANVSLVSLGGNLYAIGGFSGKKFLNTLEILERGSAEWCCYRPGRRRRSRNTPNGSADSSGDELPNGDTSSDDVSISDQENNSADEAARFR